MDQNLATRGPAAGSGCLRSAHHKGRAVETDVVSSQDRLVLFGELSGPPLSPHPLVPPGEQRLACTDHFQLCKARHWAFRGVEEELEVHTLPWRARGRCSLLPFPQGWQAGGR